MSSLFDPYGLGPICLKNRVVMAPMERSRARNADWAPEADTARYFAERAGAGLIVTGSIAISEWARTWAFEPGLYTPTQIRYRKLTRAVEQRIARRATAMNSAMPSNCRLVGKSEDMCRVQGGRGRRVGGE